MSKPVLLRNTITKGSQPFEAAHAKRLLAYPGTVFEAIEPSAPSAPKPKAAAGAKKPAAAADSPQLPQSNPT